MRRRQWDTTLYQLAEGQAGYFTAAQAQAAGLHQVRLAQLHKAGDVERMTRGVYRLTRYPTSPLGQYMEAALWPQVRRLDARGVISHESALAIYGLWDASPAKVHLTLPTAFRIRRAVPKRLALHYADLKPKDLHQVEGVPVTTAARAIRDAHTSHLGPALIRQAIDDGRRTGHLALNDAVQLEQELLGTVPRRRKGRVKSVGGDTARRRLDLLKVRPMVEATQAPSVRPLAPPLLVGEPQIAAEIDQRHGADIAAMTALGRVVIGMFGGSWTFPRRGLDRAVVYTIAGLLTKACKTFRSIQLLCERGLTADAMALMRVLGETNVAIAFILQKRSPERARIYHAYGISQSIKMLEHWKRTLGLKRKAPKRAFSDAQAGLAMWTSKLPPGTDFKKHWSGTGSLELAMRALRRDAMYATLIRHTSQAVHVSDIGEHVQIEHDEVVFNVVPRSEGVPGTCAVAREMLWLAASRVDQRFTLGHAAALAPHRVQRLEDQ